MKRRFLFFIFVAVLAALPMLGIRAFADSPSTATVISRDGEYHLSTNGSAYTSGDLSAVIEMSGGSVTFDSVEHEGDLTLPEGDYVFSGELSVTGSITVSEGTSLTLRGAYLSLTERITLLGGSLTIESGEVSGGSDGVILLDYTATSSLDMSGGEVKGNGTHAIKVLRGTARLYGGRVVCSTGDAVLCSDSLYLGGSVSLSAARYGVISDNPIYLSTAGKVFGGSVKVRINKVFAKGEMSTVFRNAEGVNLSAISLYDESDLSTEIAYFDEYEGYTDKQFVAVYKPYRLTYFADNEQCGEELLLKGELPSVTDAPKRSGFSQTGWFLDEGCTRLFDTSEGLSCDQRVYAGYRLLPPSFSISGYSGEYDGEEVIIDFTELSHPCDGDAVYGFEWSNDRGEVVSLARALKLCDTDDSGSYTCKVSISVAEYKAEVTTPSVPVEISRRRVIPPEPTSKVYNGRVLYPDIPASSLYFFEECGYTDAGKYEIALILADSKNCIWDSGEECEYRLSFEIEIAENSWIESPTPTSTYVGQSPDIKALSAFGSPELLYSSSIDGEYGPDAPSTVGRYYVIAYVSGTDNYRELYSDPCELTILSESAVALSVNTPPEKTTYYAFDDFFREGLTLKVTYNSGRSEVVSEDGYSVFYQSGDCLLAKHNGVFAEYMGIRVYVPVNVLRLDYSFDIARNENTVLYDGTYHTLAPPVGLPIGRDGIALECRTTGGGSRAGEYTVTFIFSTESENYNTPEPISVGLTVTPRPVSPTWESLSFVFDGTLKQPNAYFTDVFGAKRALSVNGGAINAGDHIAECTLDDINYTLTVGVATYIIERAVYDMTGVYWSNGSFVYNGEEQSVTVCGLPEGVEVIGYVGNKATLAGNYVATASLSYDEINYCKPELAPFQWNVLQASYDMTEVIFIGGGVTYDGSEHYPVFAGKLPIGKDGSVPSYNFSGSVGSVSEGKVALKIYFTSSSKNYLPPDPITVDMWILPAEREIEWSGLEAVYSGDPICPVAKCVDFEVDVFAEGINAGTYTATARSLDSNYKILNPTVEYTILKRENRWSVLPVVEDVYFGAEPLVVAKAEHGAPQLFVYQDPECTSLASLPLAVGNYYAVAVVPESENYKHLISGVIPFAVNPVLPLLLRTEIFNDDLRAFELLGPNDIACYLVHNDGSEIRIPFDDVIVDYFSYDSLRAGRFEVELSYCDLSLCVTLSVKKRHFDTSGVMWEYGDTVYSGEKKNAYLSGLPAGIDILEYVGNGCTEVGEYPIRAILSYDTDNYEPPEIPDGKMIITPKVITPRFESVIYDGKPHTPIAECELYYAESVHYSSAGVYRVKAILKDTKNYALEGEGAAYFVITPRAITVKVSDMSLYLFEEPTGYSYEIIKGDLVEGDSLALRYSLDGDKISAVSDNRNYSLTVLGGKASRTMRLSPENTRVLFISILVLTIITMAVIIAVAKREPIKSFAGAFICRVRTRSSTDRAAVTDIEERLMSVDPERADELITDTIARTLISEGEVVYTRGRRKAIINLDTISMSFKAGDRVDVNSLKEKGLVAADSFMVKVLARGQIDKPITVLANDFSLTAIKMIALTGGRAIKISTRQGD